MLTLPSVLAWLYLLVFHGRTGLLNHWLITPLFDGQTGLLRDLFAIDPSFHYINWLTEPAFILPALIIQGAWRWFGLVTFLLSCAYSGIPSALHEVATLEGASRWQRWWHVELPCLRHVLFYIAIFLAVDAMVSFAGAYFILGSSGGTLNAGLLLVTHLYNTGFRWGLGGEAAAMTVFLIPCLLCCVWLLKGVHRYALEHPR